MARIFITGSADGLGQLAAKSLIQQGHEVVLHARNAERGKQAQSKTPGAKGLLTADLSSIEETKSLAAKANEMGRFDVVIHNAGVYRIPAESTSKEGFPVLFAVNTLAPYILTSLMQQPQRLIYLSSGMHRQGDPNLGQFPVGHNKYGYVSYSDTKLHDVILSMAVARKWPDTLSNAVDPGWVPTRMGGAGAPDNLEKGYETQVWLAVSNDAEAKVTGQYFHHKKQDRFLQAAKEEKVQEKFLSLCAQIAGVNFP